MELVELQFNFIATTKPVSIIVALDDSRHVTLESVS